MTNHEYLKSLLDNEKIDHTVEETKSTRKEIKDFLINYYSKDKNPDYVYSGSIAKNTAIKSKYDIDIGILFNNEDFDSLQGMFDDVKAVLKKEYGSASIREQNVSIRVQLNSHDIDIVPCRRIDNDKNDVFLHIERTENTRIQSNIHNHVDIVKNMSELDTIKLLKLWKIQKAIKFKSFALELLVKKAFENESKIGLDKKFEYMMKYIRDNIDTISLVDPSNSNNNVSDSLTDNQKNNIKKYAKRALIAIDNDKYEIVFDNSNGIYTTEDSVKEIKTAYESTEKPWSS